jgi:hypothetical protein
MLGVRRSDDGRKMLLAKPNVDMLACAVNTGGNRTLGFEQPQQNMRILGMDGVPNNATKTPCCIKTAPRNMHLRHRRKNGNVSDGLIVYPSATKFVRPLHSRKSPQKSRKGYPM